MNELIDINSPLQGFNQPLNKMNFLFLQESESERSENDSINFECNDSSSIGLQQNNISQNISDEQTTGPNTGNNRFCQSNIFLENLVSELKTYNSFRGFKEIESRLEGKYTIEASEKKKKEMEEFFIANIHKTKHKEDGTPIHDKFHGPIMIKVIKDAIFNRQINSINSYLKANNSEIILQKLNYKTFISDISKGNYLKFMIMKLAQYFAYENDKDKKGKNRNKEVINEVCKIIPILDELLLSEFIPFFLYEKELDEIVPKVDENIKNAFIRADTLLKEKESALNDEGEKYRLLYILHLFNIKYFFGTIKQRKPCKNRKKTVKLKINS